LANRAPKPPHLLPFKRRNGGATTATGSIASSWRRSVRTSKSTTKTSANASSRATEWALRFRPSWRGIKRYLSC